MPTYTPEDTHVHSTAPAAVTAYTTPSWDPKYTFPPPSTLGVLVTGPPVVTFHCTPPDSDTAYRLQSPLPQYTPAAVATGELTAPCVVTCHDRLPAVAVRAYSEKSVAPTYTHAPSTDTAGEEVTGPKVRKDHTTVPLALTAYTFRSSHPTYTVPSEPTDGDDSNAAVPSARAHFNTPAGDSAYSFLSFPDTYTVPSVGATAGDVSIPAPVPNDHTSACDVPFTANTVPFTQPHTATPALVTAGVDVNTPAPGMVRAHSTITSGPGGAAYADKPEW